MSAARAQTAQTAERREKLAEAAKKMRLQGLVGLEARNIPLLKTLKELWDKARTATCKATNLRTGVERQVGRTWSTLDKRTLTTAKKLDRLLEQAEKALQLAWNEADNLEVALEEARQKEQRRGAPLYPPPKKKRRKNPTKK